MKKVLKVIVIIIIAITSPVWCIPALLYLFSKSVIEYIGVFND